MTGGKRLPVAPFLSKQLLKLSQCDDSSFDGCPVRDGLSTEVIGHSDVLTGLLLHVLMPANEPSGKHLFYNKEKNYAFCFPSNKLRSMSWKDVWTRAAFQRLLYVLCSAWSGHECWWVSEDWFTVTKKNGFQMPDKCSSGKKKKKTGTDVPLSSHPHQSFDVTKLHICIRSRHISTASHSPAANQRLIRQNNTSLQPNLRETTY